MADTFGLKIGLEGEKEFKKALSDINQSFKVLGSEMKLVQSQFGKNDNSAEALAAKHSALNKQIDTQKQNTDDFPHFFHRFFHIKIPFRFTFTTPDSTDPNGPLLFPVQRRNTLSRPPGSAPGSGWK